MPEKLLSLSPKDLVLATEGTKDKIQRIESVPLGQINAEDVAVDKNHALDLGRALTNGAWGQTQTVLLRARTLGKNIAYDVLDGMHRVKGYELVLKEELNVTKWTDKSIKSTVLYNCSDEEMWDQRILAANSVKSVKFARLSRWIKGAWETTPWKTNVSVTQAFSLAIQDTTGKKFRLSTDEVESIKKWVTEKSKKWLTTPGTIYQDLIVVDLADPTLVSRVRTGSFVSGGLSITPSQLRQIATSFPHDYVVQKEVAKLSNAYGYSTESIIDVTRQLKRIKDPSLEQIREIMKKGPTFYKTGETIKIKPIHLKRRLSAFKGMLNQVKGLSQKETEEIKIYIRQIEKVLRGK